MKKSIILFWKICLFLAIASTKISASNNLDSIAFSKKVINLELQIFNTHSDSTKCELIIVLSDLYSEANIFRSAIFELKKVNHISKTQLFKKQFRLSKNYYLNQLPDSALLYIDSLKVNFPDSILNTNVVLLNSLILNDLYKWNESSSLLKNYYNSKNYDFKQDSLFQKFLMLNLKTQRKAKNLSHLPGGGLFYINQPKKAIVNIVLVSGFIAYTTVCVFQGFYFAGALTGLPNIFRFYNGGKRATRKIWAQNNLNFQKLKSIETNQYIIKYLK